MELARIPAELWPMTWIELESKTIDIGGKYWAIETEGKKGAIAIRVSPFSDEIEGQMTVGIYCAEPEAGGLVDSEVKRLAPFERYLQFSVPSDLPSPVIGIRVNQSEQSLEVTPAYQFYPDCCESCDSGTGGRSGDCEVAIESILPKVAFLRAIRGDELQRPTTIKRVGSEYWVFCFNARALRFDSQWNLLGAFGPAIGKPRPDNEEIDRVWDVALNPSADAIALSCATRHVVRVFRLSTFESSPQLLADFPTAQAGSSRWDSASSNRLIEDGHLNFAAGVETLPNGNFAVCSRGGVIGASEDVGAIVEFSASGVFVRALVTGPGGQGLAEDADYRDWFGKLRFLDGRLWGVSFVQRMVAAWSLELEAGEVTAVTESYRRFSKPSGLPGVAGWTPHGITIHQGELLTTQNANNGVNPGLNKGVYSLDLSSDLLRWFQGEQKEFGIPTYGEHPSLFSNPHDLVSIGVYGGRECFAVADYGDNKISVIPKPEFIKDFLPYVTIPVAIPAGSRIASPADIELDIASNTAQCPIYRLASSFP